VSRHRTGGPLRSGATRAEILRSVAPRTRGAAVVGIEGRHVRAPWSLPSFAFLVSVCFILVPIIDPSAAFALARERISAPGPTTVDESQTLTAGGAAGQPIHRNEFDVSTYHATAPAVSVPDPDTAKGIAYQLVHKRGWGDSEYACLVALWDRESHWRVTAYNAASGAYGIPQALPGTKMATVGADWKTNAKTQIIWGLGYIATRYDTPCGAWKASEAQGWY
jgi:hypothetical protein